MNDRASLNKAGLALAGIAATATVVGCLGPWLSSDVPGLSENGLGKDGSLLLVLLAMAALPLVLQAVRGVPVGWLFTPPLLGALMSLICVIDLGDVSDNGLGVVETGWGLQVAPAGSVVLALASLMVRVGAGGARRAHAAA